VSLPKLMTLLNRVTSTQYLDMVKMLPQLYRPLQRKLLQIRQNLQTGIDQVHKANTYITKLTNEISEKEPEVLRLNTEIEQLNKRLSQERINLERASKSFRKKEAAARKKSEETQDLAADGRFFCVSYFFSIHSDLLSREKLTHTKKAKLFCKTLCME
jgi:regulator of replication initiation timing